MDNFIKRLEIILDYYSLSASNFADKIGVQRSSMSHLLSGRNKPSLDFILKIIEVFPDVDLYWILNGYGSFPKSDKKENEDLFSDKKKNAPTPISENQNKVQENLFSLKNEQNSFPNLKNQIDENAINDNNNNLMQNIKISSNDEKIEKIVFFYKNGSFSEFSPKQ